MQAVPLAQIKLAQTRICLQKKLNKLYQQLYNIARLLHWKTQFNTLSPVAWTAHQTSSRNHQDVQRKYDV